MANYCYNEVSFAGEPANLLKAFACFAGLTGQYASLPDFIDQADSHYLETEITADQQLCYRTRWNPNVSVMADVSRHFGIDHRHFYYEPMMGLIGEAILSKGDLSLTRLVWSDLCQVDYDAACDQWGFRGEMRDCVYDIHRYMLEEKRRLAAREAVTRRLTGVLPHIGLAGTDFTVDIRIRELRETAAPWNRIGFEQLMKDEQTDRYLFYYNRESHQAGYIGTPDEMPDTYCMLEIPGEAWLDPVQLARENELPENELLLAYPYEEYRTAVVHEIAEWLARQTGQSPER